jgi:RNA polymerase sigma factor (sigma-70 family)
MTMPSTELNTLFKHIQRIAAPAAALPDRFLLARFVADRSEAAFRELLRRHGPMVLGVCRSLLRQEQDAEDAFQATFLVLARKADSIRKHDAVGSWLHGVAYQVARNLLASRRRRRRREPRTSAMSVPDPLLDMSVRELHHAVTEELQRLPEKYRAALVLCYLEGRTQAEAARDLGCSEGVLRGRVNRGRAELQSRLKQRGLGPPLGLVGGLLPADRAVLRPELADATVAASLHYAAGGVAGGLVSAQVLHLADGVVKAMFAAKATLAGSLVVALSVLVSTISVLARPAELPAEPPAQATPTAPKPESEPMALSDEPTVLWPVERQVWSTAFAPDGKTLVSVGGTPHRPSEIIFWDPLTGKARLRLREKSGSRSVTFSADGKTMATADWEEPTASVRDAATGRVLRVLHGHTAGVNGVAFSPDGQTLATAAFDRTVRLWDVATGRLKNTLRGHTQDGVYAVAFSPDGKSLASCGADKTARVWDAATGKEKLTLTGHKEGVELAIFSPDGRHVATASWDRTIKLWDAATGEETATLTGHVLPILSVAFSPDGKLIASGSGKWAGIADLPDRPGEVKLWDVAERKELASFEGHDNVVFSVAFAPDGKTFASAGLDHTIKVWDVAQRKERAAMRCGEGRVADLRSVHVGVYAPDGKVLALAAEDDAKVVLIDPVTGDVRHVLKGHTDPILALAISPDGKTLASGGWDTTVRLWDVATGNELRTLDGHRNQVYTLAFAPDGKTLASGSWDRTVRLWNVATGKQLRTLDGHKASVRALAFSPDGKSLVSGGADQLVKVWDPSGAKNVVTLRGHKGAVRAVAFSADGKVLASAGEDGTACLWDPATGEEQATLKAHRRAGEEDRLPELVALAFAPRGRLFMVGDADGTLWDGRGSELASVQRGQGGAVAGLSFATDGCLVTISADATVRAWLPFAGHAVEPRAVLPDIGALGWLVAFSHDGRTLAAISSNGEEGILLLWNSADGKESARLKESNRLRCAAFSPDDKVLATGSFDGTVVLRDPLTGESRRVLQGHTGGVNTLAFAPDGKTLLTGSLDQTAKLWDLATGNDLATLSGHTDQIYGVAFAPNGRTAATACRDGTIRLWDVAEHEEKRTLRGHTKPVEQVAFSPDSKLLGSAGWDGTVRIWDTATGELRRVLRGQPSAVLALDFSPDGKTLATGNGDFQDNIAGDLRLWDVATGKVKAILRGHARGVRSVCFSSDGRTLASMGADGVAKLWPVEPADAPRRDP